MHLQAFSTLTYNKSNFFIAYVIQKKDASFKVRNRYDRESVVPAGVACRKIRRRISGTISMRYCIKETLNESYSKYAIK